MNVARDFLATARRVPERTFLVGPDDEALGFGDVLAQSRRVAARLDAAGVGPGERIVISHPNGAGFVTAYLGTLLHGAVAVMVDPGARPAHLDFVRRDTQARGWLGPADHAAVADVEGWLGEPERDGRAPPARLEDPDAPTPADALVMYTSGTTGTPKGVRLSHANLRHTVRSIIGWAGVREDDCELTTLPLTHLFGLAHLHVYWTLGGRIVLDTGLRDVPRVLRRLAAHRATSFPGTPAGFHVILEQHAEAFRGAAASLRYIVVNSAPMPEADVKRLLALVPWVRCSMYYGLTEASRSSVIHYNAHPDRLHSVGRAAPGAQIRVGSPDRPLVGAPGEVWIRGPHVTDGYLGRERGDDFAGEWFRTGDLGALDEEGFLTWLGRVKEQINVDGLKVSPAEVEEVLRRHPAVRDCAAVAAPDPVRGQTVVAYVVSDRPGDARLGLELRRHCKPHLEPYKIPRHVTFVPAIPRSPSGKRRRLALLEGDVP